MKHIYRNLLILIVGLNLCYACAQSHQESRFADNVSEERAAQDDTILEKNNNEVLVSDYISSAAALANRDTSRKMIRTANLRFKVKNLIKAAYAIEDIVTEYDGYIVNSSLTSQIDQKISRDLSKDSILVSTLYTPINTMELRVPVEHLDASLKKIAQWVDYLDHRRINTQDVTISLLSNELARKRALKQEDRLDKAIDKNGKKLDQVVDAEDVLASKQYSADQALLNKLTLQDQINYATIHLSIYQNQTVKQEVIANYKNIYNYLPSFGTRLKDAFQNGMEIFEDTILFFTNLWLFILLAAVGFFLYKKYFK